MKKYFLTALLGAFACIGFASADTLDWFTSDSSISKGCFSSDNVYLTDLIWENNANDIFYCFTSSDYPFTVSISWNQEYDVTSDNRCPFNFIDDSDSLYFSVDNFCVYYSESEITYSSSSGWSSSWSSSWLLNWTWQAYLWNVISWLSSVVNEFIPYMVYIALGLLVVTLGFIAVKRLMGYTSRRVTGLFSSRKRR